MTETYIYYVINLLGKRRSMISQSGVNRPSKMRQKTITTVRFPIKRFKNIRK